MGHDHTKLSRTFSCFRQVRGRILLLGLDGSGKTSLLFKLKFNETLTSLATTWTSIEEVTPLKNVKFTMWDFGGQEIVRPVWRHYYHMCEGIIFLIDSSDHSRLEEARDVLFSVLTDETMPNGVPAVILANKQDLPNTLKAADLHEKLALHRLNSVSLYVQDICIITGDGISQAMTQLADMVETYQRESRKSIMKES